MIQVRRCNELPIRLILRASLLCAAPFLLIGCASTPISPSRTPSSLDPYGPSAARIAELWWVMFGLGAAIFILVLGLLVAALLRQRRATQETPPDSGTEVGRNWVLWGGIVMPLVVLAVVFGFNIHTLAAIENAPGEPTESVRIIGRRWWWQVSYSEHGFQTANELHIPVGERVKIELESGDVIHSFWIPQLHGKLDAIPTRINSFIIQADEEGVYRGECAEYCGLQHAHMGFMVVAEPREAFEAWISQQQQPAPQPDNDTTIRGQQVFLQQGCAHCHPVRGLDDREVDASEVDLAPDLTHLYSRLTIAGATLTNNRGNLAGWITDSQHVKPGNLMPPMYMPSEDLHALLAYLETLQ